MDTRLDFEYLPGEFCNTLRDKIMQMRQQIILLWIVCRVSEKSRVESPLNPIGAGHYNSMFPGLNKVVAKQDFPLRVCELTKAMSQKRSIRCLPTCCLTGGELLEGIRKL